MTDRASAHTVLMYFRLQKNGLGLNDVKEKLKDMGRLLVDKCQIVEIPMGSEGDMMLICHAPHSHAVIKMYPDGLVTTDLQYFFSSDGKGLDFKEVVEGSMVEKDGIMPIGELLDTCIYESGKKTSFTETFVRNLCKKCGDHLGDICTEYNGLFSPIRRGQSVWPYSASSDERLMESDFDELVHEVQSKWQTVSIYHSPTHGNVLHLDGDVMLGESDLIYTQTLCCIGQEDFKGKEILILGGGDGGILHELRKENPKFITMAEIDEEVIKACRTHMRSVCGEDMDVYEGDNYKILIEDCLKILDESIQTGHLYDYVINDLTEFPVDKAVKGFCYDFKTTSIITELSFKAVKPGGKLFARGNCLGATDYRDKFEADVLKMGGKLKCKEVYVPSFMEMYCLYEISKE